MYGLFLNGSNLEFIDDYINSYTKTNTAEVTDKNKFVLVSSNGVMFDMTKTMGDLYLFTLEHYLMELVYELDEVTEQTEYFKEIYELDRNEKLSIIQDDLETIVVLAKREASKIKMLHGDPKNILVYMGMTNFNLERGKCVIKFLITEKIDE